MNLFSRILAIALFASLAACTGTAPNDASDSATDASDVRPDAIMDGSSFDAATSDVAPPSCSEDAGVARDASFAPSLVMQLALGTRHSCARLQDHSVWCWGSNTRGQLGDGTTIDHARPMLVLGIDDATDLVAGESHTCAIRASGTVACWGANTFGQLGDATTVDHPAPVDVGSIMDAVGIAAGGNTTCVRTRDGSGFCFGRNGESQFGDGTSNDSNRPAASGAIRNGQAFALGGLHGCAIDSNGSLRCWGSNTEGEIGDCTSNDRSAPVDIDGVAPVAAIALGRLHSCATRVGDGAVFCWGSNTRRELGVDTRGTRCADPSLAMNAFAPVAVPMLTGVVSLALGGHHTCVARSDGSVWCFGSDRYGESGLCDGLDVRIPARIPGIDDAIALAAGESHTCALRRNGEVVCFGNNEDGRLGDGTNVSHSFASTVVW